MIYNEATGIVPGVPGTQCLSGPQLWYSQWWQEIKLSHGLPKSDPQTITQPHRDVFREQHTRRGPQLNHFFLP